MKDITEFRGDYRFLSNFWPSPLTYQGIDWPTAEHAYQAMKSGDPYDWHVISHLDSPGDAKKFGKDLDIRHNWDKVKIQYMSSILHCKFHQNHDLMEQLISTGSSQLIEGNWWGDTFWGVCKGKGSNHLGKLLMKLREENK